MKTRLFFIPALSILLTGGCTVGPDYHQPAMSVPLKWSEPLAGGETANADAYSLATWWKSFNDPELNSLIERSVKANLDLRIAEARVREARAQTGMAEADYYPTVDASGSAVRKRMSQNDDSVMPASLSPPYDLYKAGFDASWEIDVFGGTRRTVEADNAEVSAAEFSRQDVLVTLLGEVARNYMEVRGVQRRLAIAQESIQAQEDVLALTREHYEQGLSNYLDIQRSATLLTMTQAEVPALESSLKMSIHHLGILLNQPPGALLEELAKSTPIPVAPPKVPVGLPSDLLQRRPDVQQAERELAAQTARIGVATADLFPKFSLTGMAGLGSVNASNWFSSGSQFWTLGPTVQWRIFDAGRIKANIQMQNAIQEEVLARYEKTVLASFEDVENALVAYANEHTRRNLLVQAVTSSREALSSAT